MVPAESQRVDADGGVADLVLVHKAVKLDALGMGVRQILKCDVKLLKTVFADYEVVQETFDVIFAYCSVNLDIQLFQML